MNISAIRIIAGLLAGIIFACGLGIARLTLPQTIQGGLDFFGKWEPQMFVALFSGMIAFGLFRLIVARRTAPILFDRFRLPSPGWPTKTMLLGSALFGAAWGFSGICPGPSLVATLTSLPVAIFALAMIAGVAFHQRNFAARS